MWYLGRTCALVTNYTYDAVQIIDVTDPTTLRPVHGVKMWGVRGQVYQDHVAAGRLQVFLDEVRLVRCGVVCHECHLAVLLAECLQEDLEHRGSGRVGLHHVPHHLFHLAPDLHDRVEIRAARREKFEIHGAAQILERLLKASISG